MSDEQAPPGIEEEPDPLLHPFCACGHERSDHPEPHGYCLAVVDGGDTFTRELKGRFMLAPRCLCTRFRGYLSPEGHRLRELGVVFTVAQVERRRKKSGEKTPRRGFKERIPKR